jgi:GNAT superfamily N-acetyltransferase
MLKRDEGAGAGSYTIRTMNRSEIDLAVEWAAREGWNPGLEDAECFFNADHGGFLIGMLGDNPVATISAVRYGISFGFIGFYIVRPEYRGMGFGLKIWNAALARLEGRIVGLDGVVSQQDNYRRSGFSLAIRNVRVKGTGSAATATTENIVNLASIPLKEILDYDLPFFPDERRLFLEHWISQSGHTAVGILENGRLAGFGVVRPCRSGFKVGPLFADRPDLAESLFSRLKSSVPDGAPLFLDIPEANPAALSLAHRHGMSVVFETARMYKGIAPLLPVDRIYGITTFELG